MSETQKILDLNAFDQSRTDGLDSTTRSLLGRRHATLGPDALLFYEEPLVFRRGRGVWLYDHNETPYLDAYNNVASLGHCHPHIVEAITRQAAMLNVHTRYLYDGVYDYAERLLGTFPSEISRLLMTCTGSESADLALRIARHVTGGTGIIVTQCAYHGNTTAVAEISPSSGSAVPVGLHIRMVPPPDAYRRPDENPGARLAADVADAIAQMHRHGIRFAGMIADSIFSSDGIFADPPGLLQETVKVVQAAGGVYIADEVQPGFGRTGDALWGFQRHGVVPDLVIMGKPMGNGYPMGGVAVKSDLLKDFAKNAGYFNTFGGNPVASAAGLAVLQVIEREQLLENARDVGAYLRTRFREMQSVHPCIGDVRGAGLFVGVEFCIPDGGKTPAPGIAKTVVNGLRRRHILIGTAGPYGNILKLRPPLCLTRAEADLIVDAVRDVLETEI